jgi:hypothetical protein
MTKTLIWTVVNFVLLAGLVNVGEVRAQDPLELEKEVTPTYADDWGLAITPYAWFAAQSTDVGGQRLRQSFNDLASITNLGFQCRMLARWRWINFTADWTYAEMKSTTEIALSKVDMKINQHILDLKLGANVYDTRTPKQDGGVGVWAAAGARYWDNEVNATITTQPILPGGNERVDKVNTGQTWWDPVLGLYLHFPVTPKVGFFVRATGGGFGIGNASDYLWDAEFTALFRVTRRLMISAGFRQFKYDRTDGEGEDEVRQTVTVTGPFVGLSIGIF